jgi:hypothetical protein
MEYDEVPIRTTICTLEELRLYVQQNEDPEIRRRKAIRESLRTLEVRCGYP